MPPHGVADFLVRLQRDDDVALGHEALLLIADQVGDEDGRHELVVGGAAAVEVASRSVSLNGSTDQSSRRASTTSGCASSRMGLRLPVPRSRATRLPLRGAGTAPARRPGNPAARSRAAIAWAARECRLSPLRC